ncbi:hypothetical protein [Dokdonella sp.]|uniref:hypothetical protein n=1 Tax=Dokdonella sp. TaxID=2291710 RepID=UPI0025BFC6D2|nr:hypothetical protein [Dokdonella sp.]
MAWYRQPVAWLGVAVLAASLAGCVWLIVLGLRHADEPVATDGVIFKVPVTRSAPPRP